MAEDRQDDISPEEQALADEWAAALDEAGNASQDDIDAMLAGNDRSRAMPMEEFNAPPRQASSELFGGVDGPNLDVILDIPVTISMEVGNTDITIRNLLQVNKGSVVVLDGFGGEPLDVKVNCTLIANGEVGVVNEKIGIRLTDVIS